VETCEAVVHPAIRVILEEGERNWGAYVPSVPGCIATARTREEVQRKIESALSFYFEHLHADGLRSMAEESAAENQAQRA
jgi:predicted RNase H-like HicB family nuclease